jgi:hypothetical protein
MLASFRIGSAGMLADVDIMQRYNKAAQLVGDEFAGDLPDAMQYFRKISRATGQDLNYLMGSYVDGIGRLSPMVLDNLNIVVDMQAEYEAWAKANGRTVDSLSKQEKQMIINAAALKSLEKNTAHLPDVMGTAEMAQENFRVRMKNFKDTLGKGLLPLLGTFMGFMNRLAEAVLPRLTAVLDPLLKYITVFAQEGDWLNDWITHLPGWLQPIVWTIGAIVSDMIPLVLEQVNKVKAWVAENEPMIRTFIAQVIDAVQALWMRLKVVIPQIVDFLLNVTGFIMALVTGDTQKIKEFLVLALVNLGRSVISVLELIFDTVATLFGSSWDDLKEIIRNLLVMAGNIIMGKIKAIKFKILVQIHAFKIMGRNMIQGFIDGIREKAQSLIDAVVSPIQTAIGRAKSLLGIQSPSKVFEGIGENTMLGMGRGIENASSIPIGAVSGAVGRLAGASSGGIGGAGVQVTIQAPLVLSAGSRAETERMLEPIIYNIMRRLS